jgi:NADPH2:quinone reductase
LRAIVLHETGESERLQLEEVPDPDEPWLTVRAAGINFLDVLVRQGRYPQPPPLPAIPGIEVSGELDGARVLALLRHTGGGYAERAEVDADWVFPLPAAASFEEGAAFLMTYLTAWIPLRHVGVEAGATVLVHAGAGGVGSAAIQAARHLGARVVATASTEEKRAVALELGADAAYGYDDFADAGRVDVVVDPVGGEIFERSLSVLQPLGTVIAIGYAAGMWKPLEPQVLVGRNVAVLGFYLGRLMRHAPGLVRAAAEELLALWEAGAIRPLVGATFPLERAADAHRLIEDRRHVGKVVLVP